MIEETSLRAETELILNGFSCIGGIDEVGRGALAGPVTAAVTAFPPDIDERLISEITDSKLLTPKKREKLSEEIWKISVICSVGSCSSEEIDEYGIVAATRKAMLRAIADSIRQPDFLLVDAMDLTEAKIPFRSIIKGDRKSRSIAAASIVAKVSRDAEMSTISKLYSGYGFERNKGYGTSAHMEALFEKGPAPIHRKSFAPVSKAMGIFS